MRQSDVSKPAPLGTEEAVIGRGRHRLRRPGRGQHGTTRRQQSRSTQPGGVMIIFSGRNRVDMITVAGARRGSAWPAVAGRNGRSPHRCEGSGRSAVPTAQTTVDDGNATGGDARAPDEAGSSHSQPPCLAPIIDIMSSSAAPDVARPAGDRSPRPSTCPRHDAALRQSAPLSSAHATVWSAGTVGRRAPRTEHRQRLLRRR